jgi:hypothetical protein
MIDDMLKFLPAEKILIEPHLIPCLELDQLSSHQRSEIRYHSCHAVGHDDHLHVQIKGNHTCCFYCLQSFTYENTIDLYLAADQIKVKKQKLHFLIS